MNRTHDKVNVLFVSKENHAENITVNCYKMKDYVNFNSRLTYNQKSRKNVESLFMFLPV